MEFVEPDDDPNLFRGPLHPDDRLWRHPSELGRGIGPRSEITTPAAAATESPERPGRSARSTVWMVATASALGASLLTSGLVVLAGALLMGDDRSGVVEREMVARPVASTTPVHGLSGDGIVEVARRVRP